MAETITVTNIKHKDEAVARETKGICAAWVNYDHLTPAIRNSINVSSVTDEATGKYQPAWTSAMNDAQYAESSTGRSDDSSIDDPRLGLLGYRASGASGLEISTTAITVFSSIIGSSAANAAFSDLDMCSTTIHGDLA